MLSDAFTLPRQLQHEQCYFPPQNKYLACIVRGKITVLLLDVLLCNVVLVVVVVLSESVHCRDVYFFYGGIESRD